MHLPFDILIEIGEYAGIDARLALGIPPKQVQQSVPKIPGIDHRTLISSVTLYLRDNKFIMLAFDYTTERRFMATSERDAQGFFWIHTHYCSGS